LTYSYIVGIQTDLIGADNMITTVISRYVLPRKMVKKKPPQTKRKNGCASPAKV